MEAQQSDREKRRNMEKKRSGFLLLTALVFLLGMRTASPLAALRHGGSVQTLSSFGTRGEEVRRIQEKLRSLGYDVGTADGIYGTRTKRAVTQFQRDKGLKADGIAGPQTLAALGLSGGASSGGSGGETGTERLDLDLLARIISAESKGEPYEGQIAVGAVILNRIRHPSFPNTLAGVIYQGGAFESVSNGEFNKAAQESCIRAAREALAGNDPTGGAIYFYNPDKTTNKWMRSRPVVLTIGGHVFCK